MPEPKISEMAILNMIILQIHVLKVSSLLIHVFKYEESHEKIIDRIGSHN